MKILLLFASYLVLTLNPMSGNTTPLPYSNETQLVHTLTNKKGELMGKVYVHYTKGRVFDNLYIYKDIKGKRSTLYKIDGYNLYNTKGLDIQVSKNFHGYKFALLKKDYIVLEMVDSTGKPVSDPLNIIWNEDKKVFEVLRTP